MEGDTDYPGSDIHDEFVENLQACADLCSSTPGCLFWAFGTNDNHCWTKYSDSERRHNHDRVSGNRECGKKQGK